MTLVATIVAILVVAALVVEEAEKFANIAEALSTGFVKTAVVKEEAVTTNWKEAYATR